MFKISKKNKLNNVDLHNLVDIKLLQELQDSFCHNFNLGACLYTMEADPITVAHNISGININKSYIANTIRRSAKNDEAVVSNFSSNKFFMALIPFKLEKNRIGTWLFYGNKEISHYKNTDGFEKLFNFISKIIRMFCDQIGHNIRANLSWYDKITGLQSKTKLFHDINENIHKKNQFTLALVNINFFKRINEVFGIEFGNNFLLLLSKFFNSFSDSASALYHMGADEFAFISTDNERINNIVAKIKNRFEYSWHIDTVGFYCSVSIGISSYPNDANNCGQLIKNVNTAVSIAKDRGKNVAVNFDDKDNQAVLKKFHFERRLINSVMKGIDQFLVYYQPLVDANTGRIISMEALARWNEPDLGFIYPDDFIGVAEKAGMISKIDTHILFKACAFTKKLHDEGFGDISVNVNLSVEQIYQTNIVEVIKSVLSKNNLDPKYLTLEVTESLAMSNIDIALDVLNDIKKMNVNLALDDFGTGFSSLNNLKLLPVDTLKIDRIFVNDIRPNQYNYTFIKTIIELAHCTKIKVCCEGIEKNTQWQQLVEFSCDTLQGYYFSRPVPELDFITVLKENKMLYEQL